jgi:hypothetical protein
MTAFLWSIQMPTFSFISASLTLDNSHSSFTATVTAVSLACYGRQS